MKSWLNIFEVFALLAVIPAARAQGVDQSRYSYGHYVGGALIGAGAGFLMGSLAFAVYNGSPENQASCADCFNVDGIAAAGVGYLVSVAGGIVGATYRGNDKLRIPLYTSLGNGAAIGATYLLSESQNKSTVLWTAAMVYVLLTPLWTAFVAYKIDRSPTAHQFSFRAQPVMSMSFNRITYRISFQF